MLPDRVSNPGPLTYESGALPIALRGPALLIGYHETYSHSDMHRILLERYQQYALHPSSSMSSASANEICTYIN